jgi:hypothetical protein
MQEVAALADAGNWDEQYEMLSFHHCVDDLRSHNGAARHVYSQLDGFNVRCEMR